MFNYQLIIVALIFYYSCKVVRKLQISSMPGWAQVEWLIDCLYSLNFDVCFELFVVEMTQFFTRTTFKFNLVHLHTSITYSTIIDNSFYWILFLFKEIYEFLFSFRCDQIKFNLMLNVRFVYCVNAISSDLLGHMFYR